MKSGVLLAVIAVVAVVAAAGVGILVIDRGQPENRPPPSIPIGDFYASLNVKDFTLFPGESKSFRITIQSVGGFNDNVKMSMQVPIPGVLVSFQPPSIVVPSNGEVTVDATITAEKGAKPGSGNATFLFAAKALSQTADAKISVVGVDRVTAEIRNYNYLPKMITVKKGTTVTWVNVDDVAHTATSDNGVWDSGNMPAQKSYRYTFDKVGVYPYHCTPHPFMVGTITVIDG